MEQGSSIKFFTGENVFVAYISDGKLIFKYSGFGGDIEMNPERTTTVLGKFYEILDNPYLGIRYFLGAEGKDGSLKVTGLPEGSISRGATGEENLNGMNFLDLPQKDYDAIIDKHIQKYKDQGFDKDVAERLGKKDGKKEFWEKYNYQFLVDAFKRGDNIRLISDFDIYRNVEGAYSDELNAIEGSGGLAEVYGYEYDSKTSTYKKK